MSRTTQETTMFKPVSKTETVSRTIHEVVEALQEKGFTRPTAIQAAAIPPALEGRDVLGSAPTGTGKTAAYLLPALQHLLDFPRKAIGTE